MPRFLGPVQYRLEVQLSCCCKVAGSLCWM